MQLEGRKERLINNAWRERAFEQLAAMPVGGLLVLPENEAHYDFGRNHSNIFLTLTGAGFSRFSTSFTDLRLLVRTHIV
jgi:hypothetical protein